jgi:GNAT superfamily N-acetyltransferase
MTNPVQVRGARPGDTEALRRLWTGLVIYHQTVERVRPPQWSGPVEETLRPLLAQVGAAPDRHAVFVSEVAGDIMWFVRVSLTDHSPCAARIDTSFVAEGFRGEHVGSCLLERACAWCRREFYERAGFQPLLSTHMRRLYPVRPETSGRGRSHVAEARGEGGQPQRRTASTVPFGRSSPGDRRPRRPLVSGGQVWRSWRHRPSNDGAARIPTLVEHPAHHR